MALADDVRAAAAAQTELGREYERLARVDRRGGLDFWRLVLALGSIGMGLGVPSALSGHFGELATVLLTLVAWAAIAAVNVAYAARR